MKQRTSFIFFLLIAFLATAFSFERTVFAQPVNDLGSLKNEIEAIRMGQEGLKKDLEEIKKLLKERPPAPGRRQPEPFKPTDISVEGSPFLGKVDAPVTLVEFTDYQCPFCKRHTTQVLPEIIKNYVDTGKVKYILREFPLISLHPNAPKSSMAALCANDQGKYWEMHDKIFENPKKYAPSDFKAYAESLALDVAVFENCMTGNKYSKRVDDDISAGLKLGVSGTPSFFFGRSDSGDANKIRATKFLRGAQPYPQFKLAIDELLSSTEKSGTPQAAAGEVKVLTKEDYNKMVIH